MVRLHLRSTGKVDHVEVESWCLREGEEGWVGVGWGLWAHACDGISWEEYVQEYVRRHEESGEGVDDSVRRLFVHPLGTLVWTRRRDSSYLLGEVTGTWEYLDNDESWRLDMFNVRRARWWRVGTQDSVPGIVVGNFNRPKTINPVANAAAVRYTRRLYAQLAGLAAVADPPAPQEVIELLLGALDLEDLVAVYL